MKVRLVLAALAASLLAHQAVAQTYPSKPVRLVLPYPPGGATDALTRQVGELLAPRLGQPVVVENRPGAGGTIGSGYVAKQDADGYSLLMATTGPIAIAGSLYKSLPFDPLKDLQAVSLIVVNPLVLVTRPDFPAKDLKGYLALAGQKPNGVSYGSPGKGTSIHLVGEILGRSTGTQLLHVPYKGSGPVLQDLLGGRLDSMFADLMQMMPMIQAGKVPALAVTSKKRNP
ncbi:MAG: tripartite tricarboxylate transporter substrate binding protein, partial [Burkholderiales bacterium]|nr:tripartite tricarboxylate transporter substrate binding protein [Burkholderiales bacterium]